MVPALWERLSLLEVAPFFPDAADDVAPNSDVATQSVLDFTRCRCADSCTRSFALLSTLDSSLPISPLDNPIYFRERTGTTIDGIFIITTWCAF